MEWRPMVDKLVIEMLANHTPPTCISSNILAVSSALFLTSQVIQELPSKNHIRDMRVVLKTVSKLLAGVRFGTALHIKQLHTEETSKRQIQVTHVVCQIIDKDHHAKLVCMTGDIIGANGTAEEQTRQIAQSFTHIGTLLEKWRLMTESMYTKDPELDTF